MTVTATELSRVLALEPGEDADRAFAQHIMGWQIGRLDPEGDLVYAMPEKHELRSAENFKPTQGDANAWWASKNCGNR